MGRKSNEKLYQFVDALISTGAREIKQSLGVDEDKARALMREIAHSICFQYARSYMYVPADLEFQLTKRDEEIWQEYGQDGPDGARKYSPQRIAQIADARRLTTQHLYCIVRIMQKRELASRQGQLELGEP